MYVQSLLSQGRVSPLHSDAGLNATADAGWKELLRELREMCSADMAVRAIADSASGRFRITDGVNVDPKMVSAFAEAFPALHSDTGGRHADGGSGVLLVLGSSGRQAQNDAADFRQAWLAPQGMDSLLISFVTEGADRRMALIFARRTDREGFGDREVGILRGAASSLRLLWKTEQELAGTRRRADLAWAVLDALSMGVAVIDAQGVFFGANAAARETIARRDSLAVINNRLVAVAPREAARLRQAIDEIGDPADRRLHPTAALIINRNDAPNAMPLVLCRLDARLAMAMQTEPLIAVFMCDIDASTGPREEWLQDWYGLSRVDAEIAVGLAQGLTPEQIAQRMRASIHTVRAHLKRIFFKTGVCRQTALIRLLSSGPSLLADRSAPVAMANENDS